MSRWKLHALAAALALAGAAEGSPAGGGDDPSGSWESPIGELSLLLVGDRLWFSYLAVFGPTAHLCEVLAVADATAPGGFRYADAQGAVELRVVSGGVRMEVVDGVASFCGAGWGGDSLAASSHREPRLCTVAGERLRLRPVGSGPAVPAGELERGAPLHGVPLHGSGGGEELLVRFEGRGGAAVARVAAAELRCAATQVADIVVPGTELAALSLVSGLDWDFTVTRESAREEMGGAAAEVTRLLYASGRPVSDSAEGSTSLRLELAASRLAEPSLAAAALAAELAGADPDTGLTYAWDRLLVAGRTLYRLHAPCLLSAAAFEEIAGRLEGEIRRRTTIERVVSCRCGGGCRDLLPP